MSAQIADQFFDLPKDTFHLFEKGEVKAKDVVSMIGLKKKEIAAATNINQNSIRYDKKMPTELQERLKEWAIAINLVGSYFEDQEKTMLWFQTPNELLGGLSPKDMIRLGRFKKLHKFIKNALSENKKETA